VFAPACSFAIFRQRFPFVSCGCSLITFALPQIALVRASGLASALQLSVFGSDLLASALAHFSRFSHLSDCSHCCPQAVALSLSCLASDLCNGWLSTIQPPFR
jgi:hypothetical protein